jgi:Transposase IS200 like
VPKYRLRILEGEVASEVSNCVRTFSEQKNCEIVELNVRIDHVHLIAMVPPKISISDYDEGTLALDEGTLALCHLILMGLLFSSLF